MVAAVVTTIIYTPVPIATVTATVGVEQSTLEVISAVDIIAQTVSGAATHTVAQIGNYLSYCISRKVTESSYYTQFYTAYGTTVQYQYQQSHEAEYQTRYYKRQADPSCTSMWPDCTECGYTSDFRAGIISV